MSEQPRRFYLDRAIDVTGASGTGRVADGVAWPDGTVTVRWRGERPSTVNWDRLADAVAVHGHGGATRVVWEDITLPDGLRESLDQRREADSRNWDHLSGYVAAMVTEGSSDGAVILRLIHELKPSTRVFTGTVEQLQGPGEVSDAD